MMYERKIFKQTGISRIKSKQFLRRFNERKREFLKRTYITEVSREDVVSPRNNNNDDDIKGTKCRVKRNPADVHYLRSAFCQ